MSLDFKVLNTIIRNDHPLEHIAVAQLSDDIIMINEFNVDHGGEYLEYSSEQLRDIRSKMDELIDKDCIVLRYRPFPDLIKNRFKAQSMIAFFDRWREGHDSDQVNSV